MSIKKAYVELIAFLEANSKKNVATVLDEVKAMCSAKSAGGSASAFHKNEDGVTTFIRCSYFGIWLPVAVGDTTLFGAKNGSASGYNPMCREGSNAFARKQREAKQAKEDLLSRVAEGEIAPGDIASEQERIEEERLERPEFSIPGLGFTELEDALAQPAGYYEEVFYTDSQQQA